MSNVTIDPKISITVIPDGEVHVVFKMDLLMLMELARAFIAVSDGKMDAADVKIAIRIKTAEGMDELIRRLQRARAKAWPV